jgi:hypothetical protein
VAEQPFLDFLDFISFFSMVSAEGWHCDAASATAGGQIGTEIAFPPFLDFLGFLDFS